MKDIEGAGNMNALILPDEPRIIRGRSMIGYSRRGFLCMIAAACCAPALPKIVGIDVATGPNETLVTLCELGPRLQCSFPIIGSIAFAEFMRELQIKICVAAQAPERLLFPTIARADMDNLLRKYEVRA